jgi:uncharacterized protein
MQGLLDSLGRTVRRRPSAVLVVLAVTVSTLGVLGSGLRVETDISEFGAGTDTARHFQRVDEEFGVLGSTVLVVVDGGDEGNVLSSEGIGLAADLAAGLSSDPELAPHLAEDGPLAPAVVSWATPVERALQITGTDLATIDPAELGELVAQTYALPAADRSTALLPEDFAPGAAEAGAGVVLVMLDPRLEAEHQAEAGLAAARAVDDVDHRGFTVLTFSQGILEDELESLLFAELPLLAGAAMALVVLILAVTFRRAVDVALTLVGLVLTLAAMSGLVVLAGPGWLGVTGPFTQVGVAVPVLLLGLGVDYAIHLTSRYREERAGGAPPGSAAEAAVRNVGRALLLVTATTVVGFLANVVSPVPPIRDFAVFMALGVVAALVVMGALVPAARSLVDRHVGGSPPATPVPGRLVRAMGRLAALAAGAPRTALALSAVVAVVGAAGAIQLTTDFSREEFIPADSDAATVLAVMQDRFGGDLSRRAYVLVDGDLSDPGVANAVLDATRALDGSPVVRQADGRAVVRSAPGLVAELARSAELLPGDDGEPLDSAAARINAAGWEGERFGVDADPAAAYDVLAQVAPSQVAGLLGDDRSSGLLVVESRATEDELDRLRAELEAAVRPLEATGATVSVTGEQLLTSETLDLLVRSQLQKMVITALAALALLVLWFHARRRQAMLGVITLVPTLLALPVALGFMWVAGLSFNALTAVITSVAIGFGVDYGIHVSNRFLEDREHHPDAASAIGATVRHTGAALVASATTTAAALSVLLLSGLMQVRHLGGLTALVVALALLATLVAQTSCLVLWDRRRTRPLERLNRAGVDELAAVDGVGEATARAIVAERDRRGGFGSVDEITEVEGVGPRRAHRLR